jgi:hypothetical protein
MEKEKLFIRLPIYPILVERKWFNPLRYLLGEETYRWSSDVNEYVAQFDLDIKDIEFIKNEVK